MFYRFGFFGLEHLPLENFLYMNAYKFDNENQAMYCAVDMKVIIKIRKYRGHISNFHKFWG
jgi:hypothetical protein